MAGAADLELPDRLERTPASSDSTPKKRVPNLHGGNEKERR